MTVNLRSIELTLQAGQDRLLRPKVSRAQARQLTRALRGRKGLTATVSVSAAAAAGAPTTGVARPPGDRLTGPDGTVAPPATGGVTVSSGEGGSVRTRSRFALGGLAAVAACGAMACSAGAQTTAATVGAFPMPGVQSASPETQISLRGAPPAQLGSVTVSGSESGNHTGTLRPHSDGNGASFVLDKPLRGGETVSVKTDLTIPGARNGDYTFKTVSRPRKGLGSGGGKPNLQLLQELTGQVGTPPKGSLPRYRSRPDLRPPEVQVFHTQADTPGFVFIAPKKVFGAEDPRRPAERPDDRRQRGPAGLVRAERRGQRDRLPRPAARRRSRCSPGGRAARCSARARASCRSSTAPTARWRRSTAATATTSTSTRRRSRRRGRSWASSTTPCAGTCASWTARRRPGSSTRSSRRSTSRPGS